MGRGDQSLKSRKAAEQCVHIARISHVVAMVGHRRHHDRAEPHRVDAQLVQVVQPRRHTVQVTDAVAVAVSERPRIYLVEHRVRPPRALLIRTHQRAEFTIECAAISR
jgi:hypothetical protein